MTAEERLIKYYKDAYQKLIKKIASLPPGASWKYYYKRLLKEIEATVKKLNEAAARELAELVKKAYTDAEIKALRALPDGPFGGLNREAMWLVAENAVDELADANRFFGRHLTDNIRQIGLDAIAEKLSTAQTIREARRRIIERMADEGLTAMVDSAGRRHRLDTYAELVARTTTREATNTATTETGRQLGYDLVKFSSHYPTCEVCAPVQGRVFSASGEDNRFPALAKVPGFDKGFKTIHPNCFVSGTPILAKSVMAHSSRDYVGKVVTIIAGGDKLTVTPNHPILTSKGWINAGALMKGDKVVKYNRIEDFLVREHPNDIHIPTCIEDVSHTLGHSCGVTTSAVVTTSEQFHGDGIDGEVAVINTYGLMRNKADAAAFKKTEKLPLIFRGNSGGLFNALRALGKVFNGSFRAADCIVRRLCEFLPLGICHSGQADTHSLRTIWRRHNSRTLQPIMNDHFGDTKAAGNMAFRHTNMIKPNNLVNGKLNKIRTLLAVFLRPKRTKFNSSFTRSFIDNMSADADDGSALVESLTGKIEFLEVVDINVDLFHGKVYNLQTKSGWYLANNIITHNCRHVLVVTVEALWTDEERAKYLADAGKPIRGETRTQAEIDRYNAMQAEKRARWQDRRQYEKYKALMGNAAPKTFSGFRAIKRAGGESWANLKRRYRIASIIEREKRLSGLDFRVEWDIINGKEYKDRIAGMFTAETDDALYRTAKRMLQHRDGTPFEDIYMIDIRTGAIKGIANSANLVKRVEYNKSIRDALAAAQGDTLIAMHNHPSGYPPSAADINAVLKNRAVKYGMVIGHNGTVYRYSAPSRYILTRDYEISVSGYKAMGYSFETAQLKALRDLQAIYGFELEVF